MTRPMFTIAIPSKDRSARLADSIRSVLQQTYTDLEVIVCDNSGESGVAATSAVVRSFDDPRLQYVRTNGNLPMPDNWERALRDARGEYVGVLTDRSVLRRDALELVSAEIERTGAQVVCWFPDQYGRDPAGSIYRQRSCSLKRVQFESADLLNYFLHGHPKYCGKLLPKLMTAVCRRDVIDKARAAYGRICPPVCPDYTSGYLMLAFSQSVLLIDDALFVSCGMGNGASFRRKGPLAKRFMADLGLTWRQIVDRMPTEACFTHALVMNDFSRIREALPDQFGRFEFDRGQYYLGCLYDYIKAARGGVDGTEDLDVLMDGLSREPVAIQDVVRSKRLYLSSVLQLPNSPQATGPADAKEEPDPVDDSATPRFTTVFEALTWVEQHPRAPMAGGKILTMPMLDALDAW